MTEINDPDCGGITNSLYEIVTVIEIYFLVFVVCIFVLAVGFCSAKTI